MHAWRAAARYAASHRSMLRLPVDAQAVAADPVWIELDVSALRHNLRQFRGLLRPGCQLVAVVKANAYGHGLLPMARAAVAAGADQLAVAEVDEGARLRAVGLELPILVIGPATGAALRDAVAARLTPAIARPELAAELAAMVPPGRPYPVHVEVDTGMHRHGIAPEDFGRLVDELRARGRLQLAGVYTHFAALSEHDLPTMRRQLARFEATLASVRDLGNPLRHAANTLAAITFPAAQLDAVRIGGGLYGLHRPGVATPALRPVLSLRARIVGLRQVAAGGLVGYGGAFRCERDSTLALLPIGYADGLPRASWHGAPVLVRGRRATLAGVLSMNQAVVDVTEVPGVAVGDVVTLLGADGGQRLCAEDRVLPGGSAYEITTMLRAGLPRVLVGEPESAERLR